MLTYHPGSTVERGSTSNTRHLYCKLTHPSLKQAARQEPPPLVIGTIIFDKHSLKRSNNLQFCKWDPNDRTVKVDTYLKSPYFSASNGEYHNSLSSFRIFECIPRILCIWDPGGPNDRTVKVDTYLKSPTFSASNGKCYNSLSSIWIFECILRVWVEKRTQKLHENIGDTFEKPEVWIVCVECNKLRRMQ